MAKAQCEFSLSEGVYPRFRVLKRKINIQTHVYKPKKLAKSKWNSTHVELVNTGEETMFEILKGKVMHHVAKAQPNKH